jgi:hypothetical protein
MAHTESDAKRLHIITDDQLYGRIQSVAKKRRTTVTDRVRKYMGLGVKIDELTLSDEAEFIIREKNGRERSILFF